MSVPEHLFDDSLLRTTFVPDDLQSKPIKTAIAAQRDAIEAIDSQIRDFEQRIVDLRQNRQDIAKKMAVNEAFLAPIRRVAPEILCEIFGNCLPPKPKQDTSTILLSLMHVCHAWHRIVQETPRLWARIYVNTWTRKSLVERLLRNSIITPLDVKIDLRTNSDEIGIGFSDPWGPVNVDQATVVTETTEIIRLISEQHSRLRRLKLRGPFAVLSTFFSSSGFGMKTPLLEEWMIDCSLSSASSNFASRFHLEGERLRSLTLRGNTFFTTSINHTFRLRLVSLEGRVSVSKFLHMLRVSPALEEMFLTDFRPFHDNDPPNIPDPEAKLEPVFLPKLTVLEMDWSRYSQDDVAHSSARQFFVRNIRTPAVTNVFFTGANDNLPVDALRSFFLWSATSLLRLSLAKFKCSSYQFFRIIRTLSALEVLHIAHMEIRSRNLEALIPEEEAPPTSWVCPKLTTLELHNVNVEEDLIELPHRRTQPIQSETIQDGFNYLKLFVIRYSYVHRQIRAMLEDLRSQRQGFSFEIDL